MDKLWYSVAVSALVVGCGGDVDSGSPAATGGFPTVFYGVATGGTTGIDTGTPAETGGVAMVDYGPAIVTGGSTSKIDVRACQTDSDCTQCVYITAPSNSGQCPNALGCCGGQVMNQETCNWNQGAWEANCSGQGYTVPMCPCISPCMGTGASCAPSCKNGECGFW